MHWTKTSVRVTVKIRNRNHIGITVRIFHRLPSTHSLRNPTWKLYKEEILLLSSLKYHSSHCFQFESAAFFRLFIHFPGIHHLLLPDFFGESGKPVHNISPEKKRSQKPSPSCSSILLPSSIAPSWHCSNNSLAVSNFFASQRLF